MTMTSGNGQTELPELPSSDSPQGEAMPEGSDLASASGAEVSVLISSASSQILAMTRGSIPASAGGAAGTSGLLGKAGLGGGALGSSFSRHSNSGVGNSPWEKSTAGSGGVSGWAGWLPASLKTKIMSSHTGISICCLRMARCCQMASCDWCSTLPEISCQLCLH